MGGTHFRRRYFVEYVVYVCSMSELSWLLERENVKVTREELKELVEICRAARFIKKDEFISCLVSWISDGLKLEEDELFGLMVNDDAYLKLVWDNGFIKPVRFENEQIDLLKRVEENGTLEDILK
jgi:hypothetical protein